MERKERCGGLSEIEARHCYSGPEEVDTTHVPTGCGLSEYFESFLLIPFLCHEYIIPSECITTSENVLPLECIHTHLSHFYISSLSNMQQSM